MELSSRLFRAYGDVALEVVRSNPYVLAAGEFGVDFSQADALALSLGVAADDPQRLEAGLLFELSHNNWNNGHTFLPARKLVGATAQLLECREDQLEERLDALAVRGEVDLDQVAGQEAVYLPALYEAETYIAQRMGEMSRAELLPPEGAGPPAEADPAGPGDHLCPPAAPGGAAGGPAAGDAAHWRTGNRKNHLPAGRAGPV